MEPEDQSAYSASGSQYNQSTAADGLASGLGELSLGGSDARRSGQQTIQPSGYTGSQQGNDGQSHRSFYEAWREDHITEVETLIANLKKKLTEANPLNKNQNVISCLQPVALARTISHLDWFSQEFKPAKELSPKELEACYNRALKLEKESPFLVMDQTSTGFSLASAGR
ncbi:uncharacterized protein L203_105309 [Cryptococcus depauperatus CBS 7841]|uniref:Uncharacterized protein n=1 Tax=Cryptococcus depauperatus CBS 7841 TaxID=1295531 RepID=A0A1E3HYL3_9TREE|nr:hypothetical protein L203_05679 [Cryptococcus depauperatus CBS 7841]